MTDHSDNPLDTETIDLFLDGALAPEQTRAFERRMEAEPALARQVALQGHIDSAIGRLFRAPDAEADVRFRTAPPTTASTGRSGMPRVAAPLAIAAVIALAGVGLWQAGFLTSDFGQPDMVASEGPVGDLHIIYREIDIAGRKPLWKCETEKQFIDTFVDRLGKGLALAQAPPNINPLGLSYSGAISDQSTVLLAEVDGKLVLVFVDRVANDKAFKLPATSKLSLYRGQLDDFLLYEVSPLPEPRVWQLFRLTH